MLRNTALTAHQTRLPRRQAEGNPNDNIPLIAVVTGDVDTIECVLRKIGIAPTTAEQYSLAVGQRPDALLQGQRPRRLLSAGHRRRRPLFNSLTEMRSTTWSSSTASAAR